MAASNCSNPELRSRLFHVTILVTILVKSVLAAITTQSSDFVNIAYGAVWVSQGTVFQGPYTFSANLMNVFYRLWLLVPVDHQWVYSGYSFVPSLSGFLLILILKLPLLISDILTAVLIYQFVLLLGRGRQMATFAMLIWLLNPYLTIAIEMDGTMDIVSTFLVVLGCYLFVRGRYVLSGMSLAFATIARFYPIVLMPFLTLLLLKERKTRNLCLIMASYSVTLVLVLVPFITTYGINFLKLIYQFPVGGNMEFIWFFGFRPNVASTSGMEISSVMTMLVVLALFMLRVWRTDKRLILDVALIAFLTFIGLSHFNRYYTLWVTPFLAMSLAMNWNGSYGKAYAALFTLFFASAFIYNFAYWWSSSLFFIHEFTPEMAQMSVHMRELGGFLKLGDLGTTFSQSLLAGSCIVYSSLVALRNTIRDGTRDRDGDLAWTSIAVSAVNASPTQL